MAHWFPDVLILLVHTKVTLGEEKWGLLDKTYAWERLSADFLSLIHCSVNDICNSRLHSHCDKHYNFKVNITENELLSTLTPLSLWLKHNSHLLFRADVWTTIVVEMFWKCSQINEMSIQGSQGKLKWPHETQTILHHIGWSAWNNKHMGKYFGVTLISYFRNQLDG